MIKDQMLVDWAGGITAGRGNEFRGSKRLEVRLRGLRLGGRLHFGFEEYACGGRVIRGRIDCVHVRRSET
jgi:hypothetical protein